MKTYKYLGSLFDSNREAEKDVNNRLLGQSGWKLHNVKEGGEEIAHN